MEFIFHSELFSVSIGNKKSLFTIDYAKFQINDQNVLLSN